MSIASSDLAELFETARAGRSVSMTEAEFMMLDGVHAEWADGYAEVMSPVSTDHDDLHGWLLSVLRDLCEAKGLGRILHEPFVVRLGAQIRSPDLMFVAKGSLGRLEKNRLIGPPELVIEIVSPESASRDYRKKFGEYEAAGVLEYWILDPVSAQFEAHQRGAEGKFSELEADSSGRVHSRVVAGFFFDPVWLKAPLPRRAGILREMGVVD